MSTAAQMNTSGLPKGELLGRYRTYEDAQKVVDHLAAAEGFDIKTITIVGNDLRSVEHIRSRLSYPRVAGAGAAQGAMFGFFIGLLIWLFAPGAPMINMLLSVLLGVCIWTLIGVVSYAVRRGKRDFASSSQLTATTFDVVCDFSVAAKARQLVASSGVISLNAWNDPTGRSANLGGAQQPGPQGDPSPTGASTQDAAQAAEQRPGHTDLPDGRPRYGVRLQDSPKKPDPDPGAEPEAENQAAGDSVTDDRAAGDSAAGDSVSPREGKRDQDQPGQQQSGTASRETTAVIQGEDLESEAAPETAAPEVEQPEPSDKGP